MSYCSLSTDFGTKVYFCSLYEDLNFDDFRIDFILILHFLVTYIIDSCPSVTIKIRKNLKYKQYSSRLLLICDMCTSIWYRVSTSRSRNCKTVFFTFLLLYLTFILYFLLVYQKIIFIYINIIIYFFVTFVSGICYFEIVFIVA